MVDSKAKQVRKREVPAVTRAVAILRQLSRSEEPMGVNQVARALDLVPSTCLHILRILQDEGLVAFDPQTKRYTVGAGILPIARAAVQRNSFTAQVQPHLTALSERFAVTSVATQLTPPEHMVVVALAQSSQPFRLQVDMGSRFPALISATGRCFAAYNQLGEDKLRGEFQKLVWDHPPTFDQWLDQIAAVRDQGYAVDDGNYISGVTVVAVPLLDPSARMTRSIVAIGISERVHATGIPRLAAAMLAIRDEVAGLLLTETAP